MLKWLQALSVGVAQFDDDHRRVIEMFAEMGQALDRGAIDHARHLCGDMLTLAHAHIEREEAFLREINFPNYDNVITVQRQNLANIRRLSETIGTDVEAAKTAVHSMGLAFIEYLLRGDINYKSYVEAAGRSDTFPERNRA